MDDKNIERMKCDNCGEIIWDELTYDEIECICGHAMKVCNDCFLLKAGIDCPECGHTC